MKDTQGSKRTSRALRLLAVGGIVLGTLAPATAAFASPYPNGGTPPGGPGDPGSQVKAATASNPGGSLPFTGGDVAGLAAIGAGAAAAGGLLVVKTRRRQALV